MHLRECVSMKGIASNDLIWTTKPKDDKSKVVTATRRVDPKHIFSAAFTFWLNHDRSFSGSTKQFRWEEPIGIRRENT
ncbi:hypothetical protein D3C80_1708860 [compost metagenome]